MGIDFLILFILYVLDWGAEFWNLILDKNFASPLLKIMHWHKTYIVTSSGISEPVTSSIALKLKTDKISACAK